MTTEPPVQLIGRSGSHFTRVAAMFAAELGVDLARVVVRDLTALDAGAYGGNPALKLPTLVVQGAPLFGTENICRRLVALAGRRGDPRVLLPEHLDDDLHRNAQEMVWHAMAAQVQLVVGVRFAKLPTDNVLFEKGRLGLLGALGWLDANVDAAMATLPEDRALSLLEVSLFCLIEHVAFRPMVPTDRFTRLRRFAEAYGARDSARGTPYRLDP
ncbi:MAG: glutathione S-transferase domain-containing protein [Polyangiales bacterium]